MSNTAAARRKRLRDAINAPGIVVAPGAGDALGARLIEQAGFKAAYMSGYAVESSYGKPDVGMLTLTEMSQRAAQMADVLTIPLVCDADTGYGNAINVARTTREFERAGVCAIQIEDQALPKKCGSMPGRLLVSQDEMVGKIKAFLDTRTDPNFMLIARSDAVAVEGKGRALERLHAYREAGADLLMVLGPYSPEDARMYLREIRGPVAYLDSETFTMPMIPVRELEQLGAKMVIFPLALTFAAAFAMREVLGVIAEKGTTEEFYKTSMMTWAQCNELLGYGEVLDMEKRYTKRA